MASDSPKKENPGRAERSEKCCAKPDAGGPRRRTDETSRRDSPPKTPDNFYELEMPDEEECRRRGYCEPPRPYSFGYLKFRYPDAYAYRDGKTAPERRDYKFSNGCGFGR